MTLLWGSSLVAVLLCSSAWALTRSALAPENEVPLRPTSWLPDSQITTIHLPKDRTRR
ncbi:hypothetical protein JZ751_018560 [Albula glossodonta]|uniref:Uncharacterized protein n=1 Tax=Albula glossodonta TaxID=121402 RepID=A0A8T2NQF4_9TELE|nr:hypothetical protein JZ751_018560 [Albula glossodonta]